MIEKNSKSDIWLNHSIEDFNSAKVLLREGRYYLSCYMFQQSAKEVLIAFLYSKKEKVDKSESVKALCELCAEYESDFKRLISKVSSLDAYNIPTRDPDFLPEQIPFKVYTRKDSEYTMSVSELVFRKISASLQTIGINNQISGLKENSKIDRFLGYGWFKKWALILSSIGWIPILLLIAITFYNTLQTRKLFEISNSAYINVQFESFSGYDLPNLAIVFRNDGRLPGIVDKIHILYRFKGRPEDLILDESFRFPIKIPPGREKFQPVIVDTIQSIDKNILKEIEHKRDSLFYDISYKYQSQGIKGIISDSVRFIYMPNIGFKEVGFRY